MFGLWFISRDCEFLECIVYIMFCYYLINMLFCYCNVIGKSEFRVTKLILTLFFFEMFGGFEVELLCLQTLV